jgi:hypothetical protein
LLALGQSQYTNVFEGSFTDFDWSNGDVVFANSTCFSDELMADLSVQAEKLKPGAIVVTFTKGMTSKAFEVLERKRYTMSWGPATGASLLVSFLLLAAHRSVSVHSP